VGQPITYVVMEVNASPAPATPWHWTVGASLPNEPGCSPIWSWTSSNDPVITYPTQAQFLADKGFAWPSHSAWCWPT
jgi:hypothetical protein